MVSFIILEKNTSTTALGIAGDVIILDKANNWLSSEWSASECLKSGDYYKITDLSIVLKDSLITHEYIVDYQSREFFQSHQSRQTGMINTPGLYLLKESNINYTLCIATEGHSKESGMIYIFDNRDTFYAYIDEADDGEHSSVYKTDLPIGINNQSICTQVSFLIPKAAYYYVTAKTPGGVFYNFTASIYSLYLNSTDYEQDCVVSGSESCQLRIPRSLNHKEYVLLAYVHPVPPYIPEPLSTHICAVRKGWWAIPVILGVLAGTVILFIISIASFHFYKYCCHHRRHGYIQLFTNIQGS